MKNKPKVSIIIPVYNGEKYVEFAIESALRQTYDNIEIIVVNDGSTDKTDKICQKYKNNIIYLKKKNGGVSSALNYGIKSMTGDYFSWLSHDDLYYPEKVETEISYLIRNNLLNTNTIIYSNYDTVDSDGNLKYHVQFTSSSLNQDSAFAFLHGAINGLTLLIPKSAFKNVGLFDEKLHCVQDYQLWFNMYKHGYRFLHISQMLAVTRLHVESVTNTSPKVISEGNKFWLELTKYFCLKDKKRLFGSSYSFYYWMAHLFVGGPYNEAREFCIKRYKSIEQKKNMIH